MALIRRYGLYTVVAAVFVYLLYSLSFPYDPDGYRSTIPYKSYNWARIPFHHPIASIKGLPAGNPIQLPRIQHTFQKEHVTAKKIRETRRDEVRKQFLKWYVRHSASY
jgi:mannosyl-oligosaccharide alpha-1,2-mannosidase